jgi:hypothetical protein
MHFRSNSSFLHVFSHVLLRRFGAVRGPVSAITVVVAVVVAVGVALLAPGVVQHGSSVEAQSAEGPSVRLYPGWNNVRYEGITLPTEQALGNAAASVSVVWQLDAASQSWLLWSQSLPTSLLTLPTLGPGGIYFVLSSDDRMWTQPLTAPPVVPVLPEGPPVADPPPDPAPAIGLWEVRFTRTTVLFTLEEVVAFDENGQGTVSATGGSPSAVTIGAGSVATVEAILESNAFFRDGPLNTRSGCTSCFRYAIEIQDPSGDTVTLLTDGAGASGAQRSLVDQLTSILLGVLP